MWIARDKNGDLYLYRTKPLRNENGYLDAPYNTDNDESCEVFRDMFPTLMWIDEPIEVELTLKERPIKFSLSEETKKIIEKDTGKTVEEIKNCPLSHW